MKKILLEFLRQLNWRIFSYATDYIDKLLQVLIHQKYYLKKKKKEFEKNLEIDSLTYALDEWIYNEEYSNELLKSQFNTSSLKGFGIDK